MHQRPLSAHQRAHPATVQHADAIASVDPGSTPLAAVVAYHLRLLAVFVRATPKRHFLSYGETRRQTIHCASAREGMLRGLAFIGGRWRDAALYARLGNDPA